MPQPARAFFVAVALGLAICQLAQAAAPELRDLEVRAGKLDRANVPVTAKVSGPARQGLKPGMNCVITQVPDGGNDRQILMGQITSPGLLAKAGADDLELHFILPKLEAGKTLRFEWAPAADWSGWKEFRWHDTPGETSELRFGPESRPVLRYMCKPLDETSPETLDETYKVFHHLFDPTGTRLVTKGNGGLYMHHRGLFYGFYKVTYADGQKHADVWHCVDVYKKKNAPDAPNRLLGFQTHRDFLVREAGPVLGRHRVAIDWRGPEKDVFAQEEREMTVYSVPGGWLLDFASSLKSTSGAIHLDGDAQHAGFQFRAAQEVADKPKEQVYFLRPAGKGEPGEPLTWPQNADFVNQPWDAMSFLVDGVRYTVAYLDRPENPKEARYSERCYGRFGSYFVYDLKPEEPLKVGYRVWLQEGEMTGEQVARLDADFVDPVEAIAKERKPE